jgi:hypothetical protein
VSAFDRVMAEPASLAARYALLAEWKAANHPQAALLEKQLEYRQITGSNLRSKQANKLSAEILKLIDQHGKTWAGKIAALVPEYVFHRGLVAEVALPGEQFLKVMPEVLSLAPVQHVILLAPWGSIEDIAASPLLAKLSSLRIDGAKDAVGDRGAAAIANSPHVANLVDLALANGNITREGAEALVASPYLASAKRVNLIRNPFDPSPRVIDDGEGNYQPFVPPVAAELEAKYGARPWLAEPTGYLETWPPHRDELALIHDYVVDDQLATFEKLALEVDRLAAGTDDEQITAGAKRQRLLIELDVYGLLTGQPAIGARVAAHPTLRGYHDACVQLASYHASAARIRLVGNAIPLKPTDGHVSLDWFRTPSGYTPAGVSAHDWLALCERNFLEPMPEGTGTRFVRLEGKMHVLSYRIEAGPEPKLWRAQPA